jgi:hypothetical protein
VECSTGRADADAQLLRDGLPRGAGGTQGSERVDKVSFTAFDSRGFVPSETRSWRLSKAKKCALP